MYVYTHGSSIGPCSPRTNVSIQSGLQDPEPLQDNGPILPRTEGEDVLSSRSIPNIYLLFVYGFVGTDRSEF